MTSRAKISLLLLFLLLLSVGGAAGAYWTYSRGQARSGMWQRAIEAKKAGDLTAAEELFRAILTAKPGHIQAFYQLAKLLSDAGREDEFEALCAAWEAGDTAPEYSWRNRIQHYLSRGQFARATAVARELADRDPAQLQRVLVSTLSLSYASRDREAAAESALRLADLTDSRFEAAFSLMRSGDLIYEVAMRTRPSAVDRDLSESVKDARTNAANRLAELSKERYRAAVEVAERGKAESADRGFTILHDFLLLRLATDEKARVTALRAIQRHVDFALAQGGDANTRYAAIIRSTRIRFSLLGGRAKAAREDAEALVGTDALTRLGAVWQFAIHGRGSDALQLFDKLFPPPRSPFLKLHALSIALESSNVSKEIPMTIAASVIDGADGDFRLIGDVLQTFARKDRTKDVVALIERARKTSPGPQLDLWLAAAFSGEADERQGVESMIDTVANADHLTVAQQFAFARRLARLDAKYLDRYLDLWVENAVEHKESVLYLRAATRWARSNRTESKEEAAQLRALALADVRSVLEVPGQDSGKSLEASSALALMLGNSDLSGRLAAEALLVSDPNSMIPVRLVFAARRKPVDAVLVKNFAEPLRLRAATTTRGPALIAIADCIENSEWTRSQCSDRLEKVRDGAAAESMACFASTMFAYSNRDMERARADVLRLRSLNPDSDKIRAIYAHILTTMGEWDLVIDALSGAENKTIREFQCFVAAYRGQMDSARAVAVARACVREHPRDSRAYELLGETMWETAVDKTPKLLDAVLSVAYASPDSRSIMMGRAKLLTIKKSYVRAESIFVDLLRTGPTDPVAAGAYAALLNVQRRQLEVIETATEFLNSHVYGRTNTYPESHPIVLAWRMIRAGALETTGAGERALLDYSWVVDRKIQSFRALNNGAYLLAERARERFDLYLADEAKADLAKANEWIEIAAKFAPNDPNLLDTAAYVAIVGGDLKRALDLIDQALVLAPMRPDHHLRRARILIALKRQDQALAAITNLKKEFPNSAEAGEAEKLRMRIAADK